MKYLKVIIGQGLIPLGVFIGSFIHLSGGNGAIPGGILGMLLCCILLWSFWPILPGSPNLDELYMDDSDKKKQAIDNTVQRMREDKISNDLRARARNHLF